MGDVDNGNISSQNDGDRSILASHGGDISLSKDDLNQSSRRDVSSTSAECALTVLQHQAILLDKDKQIAAVSEELQSKHEELLELSNNMQVVDNNNTAMQMVVVECERIIAQIGDERSREMSDILVTKEKVKKESEQANEDLQAVERALKDTLKRYDRTKEQIGQMKDHENRQKERVKQVQNKLRSDQERYELLRMMQT